MAFKKGNLIKILPNIFNYPTIKGKIIFIKEQKKPFASRHLFFDLNDFKLKTGSIYKFEILK